MKSILNNPARKAGEWAMTGTCIAGCAFLAWVFIFQTLVPHLQMRVYLSEMRELEAGGSPQALLRDTFSFRGFNYAQATIRGNFLTSAYALASKQQQVSPLLDRSVSVFSAYLGRYPERYNGYLDIAQTYEFEASVTSNPLDLIQAESYFEKAFALMPNRQDVMYQFATHLMKLGLEQQGIELAQHAVAETPSVAEGHYRLAEVYAVVGQSSYDDSLAQFEQSFQLDPGFDPDAALAKQGYDDFLRYYYQRSDLARFRTVVARLVQLNPSESQGYTAVLTYIDTYGKIPTINIITAN